MEDRHIIRRRITVRSVEQAGYICAHEYPSEGSVSSSQKNQLYKIESEMTKQFKNNSFFRDRNSDNTVELFSDNLVAVAFTSKQTWVRGLILEKKRPKTDIRLRIQLIDYCSQDLFSPEAVRPLPSEFNTSVLECQSMKIVLYGVVPAFFEIGLGDENKLTGDTHFFDKDIMLLTKQFEEAQSIYFEEICRVEEFYFGNIILNQNDGSMLNLKDLLLQYYSAITIPDFKTHIPEYIKNFRRHTSAFDHDLAVRKLLFPSISFSDVERSTDTRNLDVDYYRCPPVDIEVPDYTESRMSRRKNSNDLREFTYSSTSEKILPAASVSDAEQFLGECSNLIDKIVVVTGGPNNRFQPVESFTQSPLDLETFHMLKRLQIRDMTRCQKYLIPAVLSGQNVTLVEGPGAGKTVGVLISLVSLMWRTSKNKERGLGARAIVVCPYSAKCELVQKNCLQIIQGRVNVTDVSGDPVSVNVAYGLGTELEEKNLIDLLKGYDILACTPKRLLRLLQNEKTFHFARLSHIVFDDMNTLLSSYGDEIKQILDYVRRKPKKLPQRIIISDQWMPELKPFIKEDIEHQRGSLLISSYKDAALFVRLKSIWTCIDDEYKKMRNMTEMLNGVLELRNVVVVFSDDSDDFNSVFEEVRCECPRPVSKIRNFELLNAADTAKDWQNDVVRGKYPVLFCTDYALRNLQIHEADYLIHYSLPKSKNDFLFRFSVLLNRLQIVADEIMKPGQRRTHPRRWPEMCIYSNNTENDEQFPEIVKIMLQLNAVIPDTDRMRNILRRKEMVKKESGLCPNLKEFGRCHRESRCKYRHIVLLDDVPDKTLPLSGFIKILIVHVYSATHYGVRILEHATESSGPWLPVNGLPNPDIISMKLTRHFFDIKNRKIRVHNEVGDIVAYEKKNKFHRVQIIKFPQTDISEEKEKREKPKRALVRFIDEGLEEEIPTLCLIELPQSLASIPPGIVDVFICNLLPIDGDIAWGNQITRIVRDQLKNHENSEKCYFMGKIGLVLGRNLWLDSLRCEELITVFKEPILKFSVSKTLKKQQLAICHEGHLPLLLQLCKDAGLEEVHPSIRNCHSDENVLSKNVDTNDTSSDEDEDRGVEEVHPPISSGRSGEKMSARNVCIDDAPSDNDMLSKKDKDAVFEIIHSPVSTGRSEKNILGRNIGINNLPSNDDVHSNNDHVFKKPNSVGLKGKRNELNSVPRTPLKPQVEWRQDFSYIILNIAVNSDPNNFRVQVTKADRKNRLYFCAWMDEKFYEFSEILFSTVFISSVESYKSGVFIHIKMTKLLKGLKWKQLFRTKIPHRWVRVDQNNIDSSDEESKTSACPPASYLRQNIHGDVGAFDDGTISNSDSADDSDTAGFCIED